MPITFVGEHPEIEFVRTGFYTLDLALRKNAKVIGWPTHTLCQVWGQTSTGKSTFVNSISMILANKLELGIANLDLETQDPETIKAIAEQLHYDGEWVWVNPNKRKKADVEDKYSDEHLLGELRKQIGEGRITILDSIASIAPIADIKGDIGDANMGRRAFPMSQYTRLTSRELKWASKPTCSFMITHEYTDIATGLPFATTSAPGGQVKENMAFITIKNRIPYILTDTTNKKSSKKQARFGDGWIFEGKVSKNRFGLSGSDFWVFLVGGKGIHAGLTAMFDCVKLGFADIKSGGNIFISSTGEDMGKVSKIISERDTYDFEPFLNILNGYQSELEEEMEVPEYIQDEDEDD